MTELGKFEISLASNEISLSAAVTPRHRALLASYRMNAHRGEESARSLIIRDLRSFLDLGALDRATDSLIVLALFMRETARRDRRRLMSASSRHHDSIALHRGRARSDYTVGGGLREPRSQRPPRDGYDSVTTAEEDETV